MNIIDLSHTISPGMPVFPGDDPPVFTNRAEIEEDGFFEKSITLSSHTGTHIDAPAHIIPYAPTLDRMPVDRFVGQGSVIDITEMKYPEIDTAFLNPYEPLFRTSEFVLLHTGWARFWGQEKYLRNYPILSIEAALWVRSFGLKGIGVDALSVDEVNAADLPVHKILLERMLIIENLTNLDKLPKTGFTFSCFPLKLENADASPVRAVAIV
jgi:kynurenine formamidase